MGGSHGSKRLVANQYAPLIVKAFELYSEGASLAAVGRFLRVSNVPGTWLNEVVAKMLENPAYVGAVQWKGSIVNHAHPALLAGELWERVQARRLKQRERFPGRPRRSETV